MVRLLRQVSYRQLRSSWGRALLVVGGTATGVSLIVAINVINASILANLKETIELVAGPAQLQVSLGVGEIGFPERTTELVRADPDVEKVIPLVRGTISLADNPSEALELVGVDFTTEADLEAYRIVLHPARGDMLEWMADPNSIALTSQFAQEHGLAIGQRVQMATPRGVTTFTVRGILEPEGFARAFGGRLAIMDLPAAQLLLDKDHRIDQIDLLLRPAASIRTVRDRLAERLPHSLTIAEPAQRGAQYEHILWGFQTMLSGISLLCLVAGIYIIYNTTSTGTLQRSLVIAGLRIIGADAARLFRLLMVEALALGAVGTILGLGTGVILARQLTDLVAESMGVIFQLRLGIEALSVAPRQQAVIAVIGMGSALFASYFAARRVTKLDPLAIQRADPRSLAVRTDPIRLLAWWAGMVCIAILGLVLEVRFKSIEWGNFGSTVWNASVVVVAIPLVQLLARALSRLLSRVFGAPGQVATESLFRSSTRTGVTVAAVALVLFVGVTVSSVSVSFRRSVSRYYEEGGLAAADIVVSAVTTQGGWLELPVAEDVARDIQATSGVRSIEMFRVVPGQMYRGERISLFALSDGFLDPTRYSARWYRDGDAVVAARELRAGRGVTVAASLADRFDLKVGDPISLDTPTSTLTVPIVGVVWDYMADRGTVTLSRRLFVDHWGDRSVSRINVFTEHGVSPATVRAALVQRLGTHHRLKMLLPREVLDYQSNAIDRAFAFTDAIQLLIIIVTVAGIFDLLLATIWERRRELALWRVVGADESVVRRSVVIESATIGSLGALLGIVCGFVSAWIWVGINFRYLLGYHLEFHFAALSAAWYVLLALTLTIVTGYVASRQATRLSVLEGIQAD